MYNTEKFNSLINKSTCKIRSFSSKHNSSLKTLHYSKAYIVIKRIKCTCIWLQPSLQILLFPFDVSEFGMHFISAWGKRVHIYICGIIILLHFVFSLSWIDVWRLWYITVKKFNFVKHNQDYQIASMQ